MELRILRIKESSGEAFTSPEAIAEWMAEEGKADRECFWVLHLNVQLEIIEKELVGIGTLDEALIQPREVFKKAILNSANSIVTVHNHPGGMAEASKDDKRLWRRLIDAGELLKIPVLDNLIITPNGSVYSYKRGPK